MISSYIWILLFHTLENEGDKIRAYRKEFPGRANFSAARIEIFLKLEKIKQLFE
jgi:hypothetical protein